MGCGRSGPEGPPFHLSYKLGRKLGEGAFAQVRLAQRKAPPKASQPAGQPGQSASSKELSPGRQERTRQTSGDGSRSDAGRFFAVKVIITKAFDDKADSLVNREVIYATRQEVKIWRHVGRHENVVEMVEAFFEKKLCYLVMEKCEQTLMERLFQFGQQGARTRQVFSEMLRGIRRCHEVEVVHRDIKPENFLYGGGDGQTIKLCDFGLATRMPRIGWLQGICGTPPYMSPEMLAKKRYGYKTDIWSFGATLYLLLFGSFPYMPAHVDNDGMKQAILQGVPAPRFTRTEEKEKAVMEEMQNCSSESMQRSEKKLRLAADFNRLLLDRDPATRPTCEAALALPYFCDAEATEDAALGDQDDQILDLEPVMRRARKVTTAFKDATRQKADPIVQHNIDELLQKLQARALDDESGGMRKNFSFDEEDLDFLRKPSMDRMVTNTSEDRIIKRKDSKYMTHTGMASSRQTSGGSGDGGAMCRKRSNSAQAVFDTKLRL